MARSISLISSLLMVTISALLLLSVSRATIAEKLTVTIEDGSGRLVKEVFEEAVNDGKSSEQLKCTPCGQSCTSWNECCGDCKCVLDACLYLPNIKMLKPQ